MPPMNRDERSATAIKVPGSGASTVPTTVKPNDVANPQDQRSAPNDRPVTKEVRPGKTIDTVPPDFDFEVSGTTPRSASAEAMSTENPPPDTTQGPAGDPGQRPSDLPATMRIKFKGQEREYPVETIRLLAQQGLAVSENSPVLQVIAEVKRQTGVNDPKQLAAMVMKAVQALSGQGGAGDAAMDAAGAHMVGGAGAAAEAANVAAGAALPTLKMPEPAPNADEVVQEFERTNGLNLPDQMRSAITSIVKYGQSIEQIVGTYGAMFQQVQNFSTDLKRRSVMALSSAVNAEAARVAQELNIDTPEEVAGFAKWVDDTEKKFPGFKRRVLSVPAAMGDAIKTYYEVSTGRRAISERNNREQKVNSDLARAGGEMVSPRPGGAMMPTRDPGEGAENETQNFNTDLMGRMN